MKINMKNLVLFGLLLCLTEVGFSQTYSERHTIRIHRPGIFRPYYSETVIIERKYSPIPNYRLIQPIRPVYIIKPWCCW